MNAPLPIPFADKDTILVALAALFEADDVVELRAFHKGRKRTDAGYFDGAHWEDLAEHAAKLNAQGAAVYVTLNRLDPQLHARYHNRIKSFAATTATDANVARRRWLLLDFDPKRPKDTSATSEQLEAAKAAGRACHQYLEVSGWPDPLVAESGNGMHLLFPLDLPNDDVSRDLVKGALIGLAARFDTEVVTLDQAVFNAGRITKLYGTAATKGDHTPAAPWRLSRLVATPTRSAVVTPEQLRAEHLRGNQGRDRAAASTASTANLAIRFDLQHFMAQLGIPFELDQHEARERYRLHHCPFNPEHGKGEAAIFRDPSGRLGFKCQHASCADKGWQEVRGLIDGPRERGSMLLASRSITGEALRQQENESGSSGDSECADWHEPLPIPKMLLPVEPFDMVLLPTPLRPWVADIAERMQCPPDFPAVGAMVALSSVIGRKACIAPKRRDDWCVIPNLWGVVVGRPGVMKSPALSEVLKPLDRLQALVSDLHEEALREHEVNAKLDGMAEKATELKAQKLIAQGKFEEARRVMTEGAEAAAIKPPVLRRYKVTDASVEALGEILIENPWGVLAYRDELNGLLRSLDKEGQEGARAFYLQGYDGNQGYTFDRIMRGRNLHIPAVCIAMLGGIQPGKLQAYIHDAVSGGAGDDGLLQRFGLLVWPDVGGDWRNIDRFPDTPAKLAAFETFQRLDAMLPGMDPETGQSVPTVYRLMPEAQDEFDSWRREFETGLRSGDHHPALESHLSKYRKLVPAIALVCSLAEGETAVSHDSLLRALAWSEYLQSHAARAYAAGTVAQTEGARALLHKIMAGDVSDGFAARTVYLKGWTHLTTPDAVKAAAAMLCDLGHLRRIDSRPGVTGGRPSATYRINPVTLPAREG